MGYEQFEGSLAIHRQANSAYVTIDVRLGGDRTERITVKTGDFGFALFGCEVECPIARQTHFTDNGTAPNGPS